MIRKGIIITKDGARLLGGPGSGNFGHAGRPGERGGSGDGGGESKPYGRKIYYPKTEAQHAANVQYYKNEIEEVYKQEKYWKEALSDSKLPVGAEYSLKPPSFKDSLMSPSDVSKEVEDAGDAIITINEDEREGGYDTSPELFIEDLNDATNDLNYWLNVGRTNLDRGFERAIEKQRDFKSPRRVSLR